MDVGIDQAGRDRPAPRIEHAHGRAPRLGPARGRLGLAGFAHGDEAPPLDEEGGRPGAPAVQGAHARLAHEEHVAHGRSITGLASTPTPSTSISTVSPGAIGPTPAGVPVEMTSPGSSVITFEM